MANRVTKVRFTVEPLNEFGLVDKHSYIIEMPDSEDSLEEALIRVAEDFAETLRDYLPED